MHVHIKHKYIPFPTLALMPGSSLLINPKWLKIPVSLCAFVIHNAGIMATLQIIALRIKTQQATIDYNSFHSKIGKQTAIHLKNSQF